MSNRISHLASSLKLDTLAKRVVWVRTQRNLEQMDLVRDLKISQGALGDIESGRSRGSRWIWRIAKFMRTTPEFLEDGEGEWDKDKIEPAQLPIHISTELPIDGKMLDRIQALTLIELDYWVRQSVQALDFIENERRKHRRG